MIISFSVTVHTYSHTHIDIQTNAAAEAHRKQFHDRYQISITLFYKFVPTTRNMSK